MADILLYWRDYKKNWVNECNSKYPYYWHTNTKKMLELHAGDKLWLVTCGRNVGSEVVQAGFLVGVWQVKDVMSNPSDDSAYPRSDYKYRIVAEPTASIMFEEPIAVDHILRPSGRDKAVSIGRFLQGPRKLREEKVRQLREVAGPKMALSYLNGR